MELFSNFIYFCDEREKVRKLKESGAARPFTDDPVLQKYKFCNINREHDAVTIWIADNVRNKISFSNVTHLVSAIVCCRIFNHPETLAEIDFTVFDVNEWVRCAKARQDRGEKVMRGAYMMPTHGNPDFKGNVIGYYQLSLQGIAETIALESCIDLHEVAKLLLEIHGIGDFLTNQIVTDLRYTEDFMHAADWQTFVLCGPGTKRGLNRVFGRKLNASGSQDSFKKLLFQLRDASERTTFFESRKWFIDPNNLANSLCEFDKYRRAVDKLAENKKPTLKLWK